MYRMQQCRASKGFCLPPLQCICNMIRLQAKRIEVKVELPGSLRRDPPSLIVIRLARLIYEGKFHCLVTVNSQGGKSLKQDIKHD